ncbi:hypothetical protein KC19_2G239800 [Ceratodon purpureus]|uniref:Uncharacterized protein n=1 Tax=Ceratodon purpureus TaxID=3225 RepID=A0A8T0J077_CERPU|nr:hypothetical protein KC19_2G239800 [Ceratodon purpureus]
MNASLQCSRQQYAFHCHLYTSPSSQQPAASICGRFGNSFEHSFPMVLFLNFIYNFLYTMKAIHGVDDPYNFTSLFHQLCIRCNYVIFFCFLSEATSIEISFRSLN